MKIASAVGLALVAVGSLSLPAAVAGMPAADREYPNLLYNPSFEKADWMNCRVPESWFERPNIRQDTTVSHSGKASLRIEGPASGYTFQQNVNLVPATAYVLGGWVKTGQLKGQGISLEYCQLRPAGQTICDTKPLREATDWTQVQATFTTPKDHVAGWLRVKWDLKEGDAAWVDEISLSPADGKVPLAPPVQTSPAGGTFEGAIHVTLTADLPGSEVHYTVDGSDPTVFSTPYTVPIRLHGTATVKATVFHAGHQLLAPSAADFVLRPKLGPGVPFCPTGWNQDVEQWWAAHPLNAQAPGAFKGPVVSPEPRVNVADVRKQHPESTTSGIAEALAALPAGGGTLWLPKDAGPYLITRPAESAKNYYVIDAPVLILRRSNVHILSDGAEIRYAGADWGGKPAPDHFPAIVGFSSMEYADHKTVMNPSLNFYIKGITFDGGGVGPGGLHFHGCADVLVEDCTFRNFDKKTYMWGSCFGANTVCDNLWARNCQFGDARFGVYWDGIHGSGTLNCRFGPGLGGTQFLMFTNNDMSPLTAFDRTCEAVVIDSCAFQGPGGDALTMNSANVLVSHCTVKGPFSTFVGQRGRGQSNMARYLRYNGSGMKVVGNQVDDVKTLVSLTSDVSQSTRKQAWKMANEIRQNTARNVDVLLLADPGTHPPDGPHYADPNYARVEDVLVTGNDLAGQKTPQVRLARDRQERIRGIVLKGNKLTGLARPVVADLQGQPLQTQAVTVEDAP